MRVLSSPACLPRPLREMRHRAQIAIRGVLWALPALVAWLAILGRQDWELVTLLGALVALGSAMASRPGMDFIDMALAGALALGCALLQGAGHGVLPAQVAGALPFLALLLAAALCHGAALATAAALLVAVALLPVVAGGAVSAGQAMALAIVALALALAQHLARWTLGGRTELLRPLAPRGEPVWTVPQPRPGFAGVMVQAERGADGAVRLAVAGAAPGYMRVTVT